jgi:hypothetical protein
MSIYCLQHQYLVLIPSALYFCSILTKFAIARQIFSAVPRTIFHNNPSSAIRANTCLHTERHTDTKKVIGAFRVCVNAAKKKIESNSVICK